MSHRFHTVRPSSALVIAVIALFIAMGGTSYAALKLPKNSVGSKQIKPNAVSSSKIKNGSLASQDFKAGALPTTAGPRGATGAKGDPGTPGANGDKGETGPSNAYYAVGTSLSLPAGDYAVQATNGDDNTANGSASTLTCTLHVTGTGETHTALSGSSTAPAGGKVLMPLSAAAHLPSGGAISFSGCSATGPIDFYGQAITATRVGTVTP